MLQALPVLVIAVSVYGLLVENREDMLDILFLGLAMLLVTLWVFRHAYSIRRVEVDENGIRFYMGGKLKKEIKFDDGIKIGIRRERSYAANVLSYTPCFCVQKGEKTLLRICEHDISYRYLNCILLSAIYYGHKFMEKSKKKRVRIEFHFDTDPSKICPKDKNGILKELHPEKAEKLQNERRTPEVKKQEKDLLPYKVK